MQKFLLVGPWNKVLKEIGALIVTDLYEANYHFERQSIDVIGVNSTVMLERKFPELINQWKSKNPALQLTLVIPGDFSQKLLLDLQTKYQFFKIFQNYSDPTIETYLNLALEKAGLEKQYESYQKLWDDQNRQLDTLQSTLQEKIEKRTKFLVDSRRKLFLTNARIESFRKAITAVYLAPTEKELERNLNEELLRAFDIQWIKVVRSPYNKDFEKQSQDNLDFHYLKIPLHHNNQDIGSIFFMRSLSKPFIKEETEFLSRLAEAVSLSLDRIEQAKRLNEIHKYWKDLFQAITDPILLIDEEFNIIQTNKQHVEKNVKCYQFLFQKDSPCETCKRGTNFEIKHSAFDGKDYSVSGQNIQLEGATYSIHFYRDTTAENKLKETIAAMAPKAELGILSSSLAHEINNPLSGLLSFTQIMLMDLNRSHPLFDDLKLIEKSVKMCSDKINQLLVQARFGQKESDF